MPLSHRPCHFEDSDHRCWQPWTGRGVCAAPADGSASALVQHADQDELCKYNPPHGFRALCRAPDANATLRMLRALRDPAVCRYRSCAVVGSGGGPCGDQPPRSVGRLALRHTPASEGGLHPRPIGSYVPAGRPYRPCSPPHRRRSAQSYQYTYAEILRCLPQAAACSVLDTAPRLTRTTP